MKWKWRWKMKVVHQAETSKLSSKTWKWDWILWLALNWYTLAFRNWWQTKLISTDGDTSTRNNHCPATQHDFVEESFTIVPQSWFSLHSLGHSLHFELSPDSHLVTSRWPSGRISRLLCCIPVSCGTCSGIRFNTVLAPLFMMIIFFVGSFWRGFWKKFHTIPGLPDLPPHSA